MRKLIIILSGLITITVIVLLVVINIAFFREITPAAPVSKEVPMIEEPQVSIAIPSPAIPATEQVVDITKRRKALEERELEAERNRAINRAQAMVQLKAQEAAPSTSPLPVKAEARPPSAEELKELEKKGIISY